MFLKTLSSAQRFFSTNANVLGPIKPPKTFDWGSLGFSLTRTEFMFVAHAKKGQSFTHGELVPYGPLQLEPAATVLNYGQGLFEGLKATRSVKNRATIFRPNKNLERINIGADFLRMSQIPEELFLEAIAKVVVANSHWIPPVGQGSLYLRPILFGSEPDLGVAPSAGYTFVVFASPNGSYFKGAPKAIDLKVSDKHRASPQGIGHVKAIGNYAGVFKTQTEAKSEGYSDTLFLDAKTETLVEEASAANFFSVNKQGTVRTPKLGRILPGVTRLSVLEAATELGIKTQEDDVTIESVLEGSECFCTGTAATVLPIGSITYQGRRVEFPVGQVTSRIRNYIFDVQTEKIEDKNGWLFDPWAYLKVSQ
eukprot:TRINITY_DN8966_c0_g1_i1.p1 TRINITY_DN8966_c0_g1~~TRINITY_DN8966_c0_g1_i1.p1  ORF type:complete len:366 (+),score=69.48 TRINITY_DN8966_c0_g1_i1:43-1140(+)